MSQTQIKSPLSLSARAQRVSHSPIGFLMDVAVSRPEIISLAAGLVDRATLPREAVAAATESILAQPFDGESALQYGTTSGFTDFRARLCAHLAELEGDSEQNLGLSPENLVVTTGSQQLLQLVGDVLIDPGDIVLMGGPDYFVFMDTLVRLGARLRAVAMDDQGMIPESLWENLEAIDNQGEIDRVKLVYCTSYHQNPSGVTLAESRREAIVAAVQHWSSRHRILILEDAAYRELTYEGDTPASIWSQDDSGQHVILAQTFSKAFSPGMKTGYAVLPEDLVEPILSEKGNHDFGSSNWNQHVLNRLMANGAYYRHRNHLRETYRRKLRVMLEALSDNLGGTSASWTRPVGGLYVWLVLPESRDTRMNGELFNACLREGVIYVPGEFCYPEGWEPTGSLGGPHNTMRLSFGVQDETGIGEGIRRLAAALK